MNNDGNTSNNISDYSDKKTSELDHAWNHFKLHANQRIMLFKYYITFFSIFSAGFGFMLARLLSAQEDELIFSIVTTIICIAFFYITDIFRKLDNRNSQLVETSRAALCEYEINFKKTQEYMIFTEDNKESHKVIPRHKELFKKIYNAGKLIAVINIAIIIINFFVDSSLTSITLHCISLM